MTRASPPAQTLHGTLNPAFHIFPPDRTIHKELRLCDYFEQIGGYVKLGLISADVFLEFANPERYWALCEPALVLYRRSRGPSTYENFEYLTVCAQDWDRRHPDGNYPRGLRRLALGTPTETASLGAEPLA